MMNADLEHILEARAWEQLVADCDRRGRKKLAKLARRQARLHWEAARRFPQWRALSEEKQQ